MNIVVIPARGGSKRIPRKNIKSFCGKPMLAYSIDAALDSGVVDKVIVSTEDEEIASVAREYGAEVPFLRPASLADDHTGTSPVIRYTIQELLKLGWELDYCACIYATAPLLTASLVRESYEKLLSINACYIFTAARYSFPIQRAIVRAAGGGVIPFDAQGITQRSQDLQPAYHDAGQLYWGHHTTWLDLSKRIFSEESEMVVLPDHLVQDIDTPEDWLRAEMLYKLLKQQNLL